METALNIAGNDTNNDSQEKEMNFWINYLAGQPVMSRFPSDFQRSKVKEMKREAETFKLPDNVTEKLLDMAKGSSIGSYIILLSAVKLLLHRYCDSDDIIVGIPVFRQEEEARYINNILLLRSSVKNESSFKDLILEVKDNVTCVNENQNIPFDRLIEMTGLTPGSDAPPVYTIILLKNLHDKELIDGYNSDMVFLFNLEDNLIDMEVEYNSSLYTKETVKQIINHYNNAINFALFNPKKSIDEIEIMEAAEINSIIHGFNNTKAQYGENRNIHSLFEEQADKMPDNIAVVYDNKNTTYRELNMKANRLAHLLTDKGVRPGDYVAVILERSVSMITAVMGIMKAGGVYIPFEPAAPRKRTGKILSDLGVRYVVTQSSLVRNVYELHWRLEGLKDAIFIDVDEKVLPVEPVNPKEIRELWDLVSDRAVDQVTAGGFYSSYTGEAFSESEVESYRNHVVELAKPYLGKDKKVLEIGCGSGLIMFSVAPCVDIYTGVDPSEHTLRKNEEYIEQNGIRNISLIKAFAHELGTMETESVDIIILASTIQFFPGYMYLEEVMKNCLRILKPGGVILLADIMDFSRMEDFRKSILDFRTENPGSRVKADLENELYIDERYFKSLPEKDTSVSDVKIIHRNGKFKNELDYRFDVIICKEAGTVKQNEKVCHNKLEMWTGFHINRYSHQNPDVEISSDQLAYVIYTSGSTGVPKGVAVKHKPVINLIEWVNKTFDVCSHDRLLFVTSLCFDLSVYDIFGTLASGGSIRVVSSKELHNPEDLANILLNEPITFWDSAPAALQQLVPYLNGKVCERQENPLRLVFLSGDWIPVTLPDVMKSTFPGLKVISLGGATEATVWSNYYIINHVDPRWVSIPYGKPIQNARYYILDEKLRPCPISVAGDLYIGGDCLAQGYINDEQLTDTKFVKDPFSFETGAKMYKTGDTARWQHNGNMEFLGRIDHQVKIRGYRIEPGEIESHLAGHKDIENTVVIAGEDKSGNKYLCAYYVSKRMLMVSELRDYLSKVLPEYMIPSYFVNIEKIPVTQNGKLDRRGLPEPIENINTGNEYIAPRSALENVLADVWQNVLRIERVGLKDDFFELGGHSLLAIKVVEELKSKGVDINLLDIFNYKTIEELADFIANSSNISSEDIQEENNENDEKEALSLDRNDEKEYIVEEVLNYLSMLYRLDPELLLNYNFNTPLNPLGINPVKHRELADCLESEFNIDLTEEKINIMEFNTIAKLADLVERKRQG